MAEEMIHMPPRFYKLYVNKVREMPSLKTEDIQGAKPTKFTYAKSDILEQYHTNRSKSQTKPDANPINYWGAIHPPPELYETPQSIHKTSYISHPTEHYIPKNNQGTPSLFRPERPPMQSERSYATGYQYSNIQSPKASAYSSYNNLSTRDPQPRAQVRDSLDTLQNEYERRDPYRQNLPYGQQQEQNARMKSIATEQNMFKSSSSPMMHDTRSYNYNTQQNFNHEQFEKNKALFFGLDETRVNQPRQGYATQYQQQQYSSRPAPKEINNSQQNFNHEQFEKNKALFFGHDETRVNQPRQGYAAQSQQQQYSSMSSPKGISYLNTVTQQPITRSPQRPVRY